MTDRDIAVVVASRFRPTRLLTRDDLVAIAWFGAWKAGENWREGCGASRKTFRWNGARYAVLHALRDTSGVSAVAYESGLRLRVDDLPDDWDAPDRAPGPEACCLDRAGAERIWRAIGSLPPVQRAAMTEAANGEPRTHSGQSRTLARRKLQAVLGVRP